MYCLSPTGPWKPPVCVFRAAADRPVCSPATVQAVESTPELSAPYPQPVDDPTHEGKSITFSMRMWKRLEQAMDVISARFPEAQAILAHFDTESEVT